jgi:polyferredoxin
MRAAFHIVVSLLLSGSIALAVVPPQTPVPQTRKTSCCAKAKTEKRTDGCARHSPKSDQEKQCCGGCVVCLAVIPASATPFVYPPTGEESFAAFAARELVRPHRPQVPPPRFLVA